MKKFIKQVTCLLMAVLVSVSTFYGCDSSSSETLRFWIYGQDMYIDMYTELTEEFNATYGKEHGIEVKATLKPNGSYGQLIETTAASKSGPDVFLVEDANIKTWIIGDYFCPIGEELDAVTDISLGDLSETTISRLRYDVNTNTSSTDDALYGLPVDAQPTALYYNTEMFKKAGIIVISVDEENLEAWNKNEIADSTGKYKRDYGITINVPAKGFYRENPYYVGQDSSGWMIPANDELLIFNNRIAMNWDEYDDISMIFSASYNPSSKNKNLSPYGSQYGNYTEWWYMYLWSIGADCLTDLSSGNGEWNFSLLDPNNNYIVIGESYTGKSGTIYKKGETLSFLDKMDCSVDEILESDGKGGYKHANGTTAGIASDVKAAASGNDAVLAELPSACEAFKRYVKLTTKQSGSVDGERGLEISPHPNTFSNRTPQNYFWSGNIAMLTCTSAYTAIFAEQAEKRADFDFDMAPLPVYKQYEDPGDPDNDEVVVAGKTQIGHSNAYSMVVRTGSNKKDKAAAFIKWMAGVPGQTYRAKLGFFPSQPSLISEFKTSDELSSKNMSVFVDAVAYQTPGDWWYMSDYSWIDVWATPLNDKVRNGIMDFNVWVNSIVDKTNNKLKDYKKKS